MFRLLLILLLLVGVFVMSYYNRFVKSKNFVESAWSGLKGQFQRRYTWLQGLIKLAKIVPELEEGLILNLERDIKTCLELDNISGQLNAEERLSLSIHQLLSAIDKSNSKDKLEQLPAIKREYQFIHKGLKDTSAEFNSAVNFHNNTLETFPGNIVAGMFGFGSYPSMVFNSFIKEDKS